MPGKGESRIERYLRSRANMKAKEIARRKKRRLSMQHLYQKIYRRNKQLASRPPIAVKPYNRKAGIKHPEKAGLWHVSRSRLRDRLTSGKGPPPRLHTSRHHRLRDAWSERVAAAGWVMILPRDLDRDGPAWAASTPKKHVARDGGIYPGHRPLGPPTDPKREPMPPAPDAPESEWQAWERAELQALSLLPGWKSFTASAKTSAGLRKRARLLRFLKGKPLWYVARGAGMERGRLKRLLCGLKSSKVALGPARPTWREARRLARALGVSLDTLAHWLDAVELDPIV